MKLPKFLGTAEGKLISFVLLIVIILLGYYFYATGGKTSSSVQIEVNATDHVKGNVSSQITLVEFGDFQCPACGAWEPVVEEVVKQNSNNIKFVFKNFPLTQVHQNALLGAKAAEAAGVQGKYWEMHDLLYKNQSEWSESVMARDSILNYAKGLKLDMAKFESDLNNKSIEDNILAEYSEGTKLGVEGTPTFFLDGQKVDNAEIAKGGNFDGNVGAFNTLIKKEMDKQAVSK